MFDSIRPTLAAPAIPAALLALAFALPAAAATGPVAAIDSGKLEGAIENGIASWNGIPYAAPPVGALRWRAPQPPAGWTGIRAATSFGNDCMQVPFPQDLAPLATKPAEDCLYLNVWKPAAAKGKLPVIVWIHGGGFVNGGTSPAITSGAPLAKRGVMVVSFNYRLGRFGSFAHPALASDAANKGQSGNYGYLDQLAALDWVQRNIAAFGGDPANVTIMGESAGAIAVNTMLTSPLTQGKGLFARAAILSGGEGIIPGLPSTRSGAEQWSIEFAGKHGIAADDPAALSKLRALTPEQVVDGFNLMSMFTPGPRVHVGPFADGQVAVEPLPAYAAGRFVKVPVMIGATDDDMGGRTGFMVAGARKIAGVLADQGVPVYAYRFSYVPKAIEWPGGAKHATDVTYFFDTVASAHGDKTTARDIAMSSAIATYLVNFAKNGDPNGAQLPQWPRYQRDKDELIDFAASGVPVPQKDPLGPEIDAAQRAMPARQAN
ncbi:carboxylesterase/lipase family protein [Pseudoduganella albidiflava]|uniref:Carboxylic ester hydrolase n=1 Tax=Pseudoduganella albidiflava TaxID=321983 RepID=A0A411WVM2_9BURK|nr:carboxylesterase family protein [Pseudoduganella albidiflava]QBI00800.1 carboxylesterase [Pseudoduganella albidiflava]GGY30672.1 carboxylic ester hydrolase [Pseudoduganella albidiflava]